ncbi:hypothetical protein GGX14DRAFT_344964, partial [Mycena pura]
PPKTQSKIYQLLIKTHKLTILTTVPPSMTVDALKAEVLSALSSDVNQVEGVPSVSTVGDFQLCKAVKERGKLTGEFQVLKDVKRSIKDVGVVNWEPLFVQFRDPKSGKCDLEPVVFTPFEDDEDQVTPQFTTPAQPAVSSTSRGKRKALPD